MIIAKYKISLIAAIATLLFSLLPVAPVLAGSIADITFETSPLFGATNIMPGDSVSKWAKVANKVDDNIVVTTTATKPSDPDRLGDQMNLTITKGATELYNNTMTAFFSAGNVNLGSLAVGETGQFDYAVTFASGAGNDLQGKTMTFDISLTAQAPESVGGEAYTVTSSGGGGGGGGMAYTFAELNIDSTGASLNAQAKDTSIIVTWLTNKAATSRVIYDTVSHPDLSTALPPNYGYAYSTILDPTLVTGHSVPITGLTPGTTYYLRPLSSASPEKYGGEIAIATTGVSPITSGTEVSILGEEGAPEPETPVAVLGIELKPPAESAVKKIAKGVIDKAIKVLGQESEPEQDGAEQAKENEAKQKEAGADDLISQEQEQIKMSLGAKIGLIILFVLIIIIILWLIIKKSNKK